MKLSVNYLHDMTGSSVGRMPPPDRDMTRSTRKKKSHSDGFVGPKETFNSWFYGGVAEWGIFLHKLSLTSPDGALQEAHLLITAKFNLQLSLSYSQN